MCEDILKDLETDLEEYNEIFLVSGTEEFQDKIVDSLLFLFHSGRKNPDFTGARYAICLQEGEYEEIESLYYMYEFSNRFHLISKMNICGSLFCLEDTGVINFEEVKAIWTR